VSVRVFIFVVGRALGISIEVAIMLDDSLQVLTDLVIKSPPQAASKMSSSGEDRSMTMSINENSTTIVKSEPLEDQEKPAAGDNDINAVKAEQQDAQQDAQRAHVSSDDDDDDEFYKPPEPKYDKASSLKFRKLCNTFEKMWKYKSKKPKDELLDYILPQTLRKHLNSNGDMQQSIFPLLRLMVPDKDTTRPRLWMKEKTIADCWAKAIGLSKSSKDYKNLEKYNDPTHAGMTACGDISMCVYEVVKCKCKCKLL